nr:fructose-bisphosphate aldolase 1, chloroplastic-like [Tanacetum cinerariifolium]
MAPEKERINVMILYVDLKCPCCYKKVRKLIGKFPQIRDQVFDLDKNRVSIKVVCCDPERLRDRLCCKGGRTIQSIEIVKNKPPPLKQPTPAPAPKPVVVEKPKPDPPKPKPTHCCCCPPKPTPMPPPVVVPQPQPVKMPDPVPQPQPVKMPDPMPMPMPMLMPMPMDGYHLHQPFCPPVSACCQECYEGRDGGPCHYGYGRSVPPPPCYDYYGYQYPSNRPGYVTRRTLVSIPYGPSALAVKEAAWGLARYAAISQTTGWSQIPIVEPEILVDGEHKIDTTFEVAKKVWAEVFFYLAQNNVLFEGILLKPITVTPGADSKERATPQQVVDYTLKLL